MALSVLEVHSTVRERLSETFGNLVIDMGEFSPHVLDIPRLKVSNWASALDSNLS